MRAKPNSHNKNKMFFFVATKYTSTATISNPKKFKKFLCVLIVLKFFFFISVMDMLRTSKFQGQNHCIKFHVVNTFHIFRLCLCRCFVLILIRLVAFLSLIVFHLMIFIIFFSLLAPVYFQRQRYAQHVNTQTPKTECVLAHFIS